jgi:hypothetical protein
MPQITVSEEVMGNLQALCLIDGQSEDNILRRLLCCPQNDDTYNKEDYLDATYGIRFAKGFMIFRTYKGKSYSARVSNGYWVLDGGHKTGETFDSLNQLSQALVDGNENAWKFWYFHAPNGEIKCISELRDPDLVQRRRRRKRPQKSTVELIGEGVSQTIKKILTVPHQPIQMRTIHRPLPAEHSNINTNKTAGRKPWECA